MELAEDVSAVLWVHTCILANVYQLVLQLIIIMKQIINVTCAIQLAKHVWLPLHQALALLAIHRLSFTIQLVHLPALLGTIHQNQPTPAICVIYHVRLAALKGLQPVLHATVENSYIIINVCLLVPANTTQIQQTILARVVQHHVKTVLGPRIYSASVAIQANSF